MTQKGWIRGRDWILALGSGLLLAASFPPLMWKMVAWVALVPLLVVLGRATSGHAFRLGWIAGMGFWLCSLHWLTNLPAEGWFIISVYLAWITLAAYCSLYLGCFAWLASSVFWRYEPRRWPVNLLAMVLLTALWVGLEYGRSTWFTGFSWNTLGVSQFQNLVVAQLAAWGGVYAVSALVIFFNLAMALTFRRYLCTKDQGGRVPPRRRLHRQVATWRVAATWHPELLLALFTVVISMWVGIQALSRKNDETRLLKVGLIQPGIPQVMKWSLQHVDHIYERLNTLTRAAMASGDSDLLIWPETALPDEVRSSARSHDLVKSLVEQGTPLLVGSMDRIDHDQGLQYYNNSYLFDVSGEIAGVYEKRHLVIFGEYVPFQETMPFIKSMSPVKESFSAGYTSTVFRVGSPPVPFSVLICFEDTVASLARESVLNGARLLINQTNDAWFDKSSASLQHMSHCVFRCIENRVPAARVANTGVSCVIDAYGRLPDTNILRDAGGRTLMSGFLLRSIRIPAPDDEPTFYTRYGDRFAHACLIVSLGLLAFHVATRRRQRGSGHLQH